MELQGQIYEESEKKNPNNNSTAYKSEVEHILNLKQSTELSVLKFIILFNLLYDLIEKVESLSPFSEENKA